ncbi:MAG: Mth938-like domain-containing protein [Aquabacterium sp.]|uniref:Mth938-like domain-containing protein n=1 Tax=Aquabacterium sp. TaxID=1872578 RepID=UPI003BE8D752
MKLHADRAEGVNVIHACDVQSVSVNGTRYAHSILIPHTGDIQRWTPASATDLQAADLEALAALQPEVVILGTGQRQQFLHPRLMAALLQARIGVETMDTTAACRTYNVLAAEGRRVLAALLIESSE